jgi:cyclopropane-fatty-acyl-phospholipid synthase
VAAPGETATRVAALLALLLGEPVPLAVRAWDGSQVEAPDGDPDAPVLDVTHRRALRRLLWDPDEIGAARAWVSGDLDVVGDLPAALERILARDRDFRARPRREPAVRAEIARLAVLLGAVGPAPRPPAEEILLTGERHSPTRDRAAARVRDDLGDDFFRLVLGPTLVQSSGRWAGVATLEQAQAAKLDEVCRLLDLQPGQRLLDLGCGFGALLQHAAAQYGATAVGVTVSARQAAAATERAAAAGLGGAVEVRVQDYRDVDDGPYDAVVSLGLAEHVGRSRQAGYADVVQGLLRPGGLLVQEQTLDPPGLHRPGRSFADAYVNPDVEPPLLGDVVGALDQAGLDVLAVTNLRDDDAATLRAWSANLERRFAEAAEAIGAGRARAWRLHLAAAGVAATTGLRRQAQVVARRFGTASTLRPVAGPGRPAAPGTSPAPPASPPAPAREAP